MSCSDGSRADNNQYIIGPLVGWQQLSACHVWTAHNTLLPVPAGPAGGATFTNPGTYTWTPPEGVKNVSVVCVGAGGGAGSYNSKTFVGSAAGGGGEGVWGGLAWRSGRGGACRGLRLVECEEGPGVELGQHLPLTGKDYIEGSCPSAALCCGVC